MLSILVRFSFVFQKRDFLHELEQGRLRLHDLLHGIERSDVTVELFTHVAPLNFVTRGLFVTGVQEEPAFTTARLAWRRLIRTAWGVLNRILFRAFATVDALVCVRAEEMLFGFIGLLRSFRVAHWFLLPPSLTCRTWFGQNRARPRLARNSRSRCPHLVWRCRRFPPHRPVDALAGPVR